MTTNHSPTTNSTDAVVFAMVANIPAQLRSVDLRVFFTDAVEAAAFHVFHYRHRPLRVSPESEPELLGSNSESGKSGALSATSAREQSQKEASEEVEAERCCCVIKLASTAQAVKFKEEYQGVYWSDRNGIDTEPRSTVRILGISKVSVSRSVDLCLNTTHSIGNHSC
jgi:hypothetical protein